MLPHEFYFALEARLSPLSSISGFPKARFFCRKNRNDKIEMGVSSICHLSAERTSFFTMILHELIMLWSLAAVAVWPDGTVVIIDTVDIWVDGRCYGRRGGGRTGITRLLTLGYHIAVPRIVRMKTVLLPVVLLTIGVRVLAICEENTLLSTHLKWADSHKTNSVNFLIEFFRLIIQTLCGNQLLIQLTADFWIFF